MHQSSQDVRAGSKTVEEQQKTISTLRDERNGLLQSLKALQDVENGLSFPSMPNLLLIGL
jgi:hypothetical protein